MTGIGNSDNRYGVSSFIVGQSIADGCNYTTIQSAINDASSGQTIFIRPGTYTENLTLKSGVNICANACDSGEQGQSAGANVTIIGKATATFTGCCVISGIRLQTNGDYVLSLSGSNNTFVQLQNCLLNATNANALQMAGTPPGGGARIQCFNCTGDLAATRSYFDVTGASGVNILVIDQCTLENSGSSTGASTVTNSNNLYIRNSTFKNNVNTSNSAGINIYSSDLEGTFTVNGTIAGGNLIENSTIISVPVTNTAVLIGAGATLEMSQTIIGSTNASAVTVTGILNYSLLTFSRSSSAITGGGTITQLSDGLPFTVPNGGTGISSATAFAPIVGGTTSTGAFQSASTGIGTVGFVLTSTGASSLPTWQASGGGGGGFTTVAIQTFTASGTYTPTASMKYCIIETIGGGGGGGGSPATGVGQVSGGGGGGAGEYARGVFSAATIGASKTVTIGAGGSITSGVSGGTGGTTSVGTLITSIGGSGGVTFAASTSGNASGGAGGDGGTGGSFRSPGTSGDNVSASFATLPVVYYPNGASSQYGAGGLAPNAISSSGNAAQGYGCGGSGCINGQSGSAASGGAARDGIVVITEYI